MKVLLSTIGSSGDVNPFIALSLALRERGHEAVLVVNPHFRASVEAAGVPFEPLGDRSLSPEDLVREMPSAFGRYTGGWVLLRHVLAPLTREMYISIKKAARKHRPDVMVGHQISFGLPWVAREMGLPWATCVLAPGTLLSAEDPSVYAFGSDLRRAPMWCRRAAQWGARQSVRFILDVPLNRLRRRMGIPACADTMFGEMLGGDAVLGLWSPTLRPRAGDDPPTLRICGFAWYDRRASDAGQSPGLEARVEGFLQEGEPPIVFTLGSVLSHTADALYAAAARACGLLGRRGLLVTGRASSAPRDLPRGVLAVDYAPYGLLLSRGAATVHHGGVGTTAQALRAGRPTAVIPHAHDQFDNAARVQRLGVSVTVHRRRPTPAHLARALGSVLGDPAVAACAAAVGATIRGEDGAAAAVAELEAMMGRVRGGGSGSV